MRDAQHQPTKRATSASALALGLGLGLVTLCSPHLALASTASAGGGLPYESFLNNLTHSIQGPVAYTLSLLGVAGAGGTLIFGGDLNGFLRAIILLVCFAALLISAPSVLSAISGAGAVVVATAPFLGQAA